MATNVSHVDVEAAERTEKEKSRKYPSKLPETADPPVTHDRGSTLFSEREGHNLKFENIVMKTKSRDSKKKPPKEILKSISGHVPPRRVTAIMGPSGSGKTSLLKVLTGRAGKKSFDLSGKIKFDGRLVDPTDIEVRRELAYVEQEVSIPATSTPREAIRFSARLRLDRSVTHDEIESLVNEILKELGLEGCADTMIGGGVMMSGGLSGGEKKRTQLGVELVTKPDILILDEPTSGLDSYGAETIINVCQRIAQAGASLLLTIHQPPPTVVRKLDHLILLLDGRLMYDGSLGPQLNDYFAAKGFAKPDDYNIADWILTVAQVTPIPDLEEAGFFQEDAKKIKNEDIYDSQLEEKNGARKLLVHHVGLSTEIRLLFGREMKRLRRDKLAVTVRVLSTGFFGLFYGLIYLNIGTTDLSDPLNLQAEFGAIANILISTMFGVAQSALLDFPKDRPVFLREYSTNHYSVLPYFLAKLSIECTVTFLQALVQLVASYFLMALRMRFVVFLAINFVLGITSTSMGIVIGSMVEDPNVAAELMPVLIVPQLLFSGFFISIDLIPEFLRWAQYLCSLTYAIRLSSYFEFGDCTEESCQQLLARNQVIELDTFWYWIILIAITTGFRLAGMIILRGKANF
ncbi:ABC transporter [Nitzschia inconspicua]|uniref:ABC transporter n=1 Tax=Nitzschia inconspicua TaxID=303405 RepID=A0A9K3M2B5_9STRA|nr:ABC transporter [Nitzschia inconspicua]